MMCLHFQITDELAVDLRRWVALASIRSSQRSSIGMFVFFGSKRLQV
jgi:hypothetical protein